MYILKNAWKCIARAKGRNFLIGIIVLVIATAACLGLSIRQAAEIAKAAELDTLSVTATISYDRLNSMRGERNEFEGGDFDPSKFSPMLGGDNALTLEEYQIYAAAESVQDFHFTLSASLNGSENFLPVSDTADEEDETDSSQSASGKPGMPNMFGGGFQQMMGMQSDFTVMGYSKEAAMTSFMEGTASITDGTVFEEGTTALECIISEELAIFNNLAVGDSVIFQNPNNEEETYTFTVVGFYSDTTANEDTFSFMGGTSSDPANRIYMSYEALQSVIEQSVENAVTQTDENTGREFTSEINGSLSATYVLADKDAYYAFEDEVRELGLDDSYTVSSTDIESFEARLQPLETLSTMAGYFLLVILLIGAIILIVLNAFNIRERKYEIGVLTAMGMKKGKVALQFLTEIFIVTMAAVLIGAAIGGVTSVPVTNALLANQTASMNNRTDRIEESLGRGEGMDGFTGEMPGGMPTPGGGGFFDGAQDFFGGSVDYLQEVDQAMNLTVVWQLLLIAVLLTLVSGAVSMLFIMRYDPLKILSNRD